MTTPSWRISNEPEERRKRRIEKKMPFIVHYGRAYDPITRKYFSNKNLRHIVKTFAIGNNNTVKKVW
jgi:hypothetical protein